MLNNFLTKEKKMKIIAVLAAVCVLPVVGMGTANANELSDLKKEVEMLRQSVKEFSENQASQVRETGKVSRESIQLAGKEESEDTGVF